MSKLKAIIFDVDGTLANTEEAHRLAFNYAFEKQGLDWDWTVELYTKLLKVTGGKERIRHFVEDFLKQDIEQDIVIKLHEMKNARYQAMALEGLMPLRCGIENLIKEAREMGIRIAIATTTTPGNVENLIVATLGKEALDWFEVIAAADVVPIKKPRPDVYEYVLDKMNLKAEECVALEDSYNGIAATRAINMPTVITQNNYTEKDVFDGAMIVVDQLGDESSSCQVITGDALENAFLNVDAIKQLHAAFTQ